MKEYFCENCGSIHDRSYGSGRFCCNTCALSYSTKYDNKNELKDTKCVQCNKEFLVNKRSDTNKTIFVECKQKQKDCEKQQRKNYIRILKDIEEKQQSEKVTQCKICGNNFAQRKNGIALTCSRTCRNYSLSLSRSNYLLKNGTTNFNTKQELFSYDFVKDFLCDSKFEQACIIYLIDVFGVKTIERFKSILNFWEGENHRTFNPDFFCKKDDEIFIVECKMKWIEKNNHDYNRTIPIKKIALQNFCDSRGYNMLWLDYDYDKKLKKIYLDHLNSSK